MSSSLCFVGAGRKVRPALRAAFATLAVGLAAAGCGAASVNQAAHSAAPSTTAPAAPPAGSPSMGPAAPGGPIVAQGHGWSPSGVQGSYAGKQCHVVWGSFRGQRQPLPDPACNPGAIDPTVTQGNLDQTVCRHGGYTSGVRPPESVTGPAKRQAIAAYGAYAGPSSGSYEMDHLIPLSLGGASAVPNLWPEQNVGGPGPGGQNPKDDVELALHDAVCSGKVPLASAQRAIALDWTTAEAVLKVSG